MANYKVTSIELTNIANAIRAKGGTSAQLEFPDEFVSAIQAISTSSSSGIGTYMRGNIIGEYDNRSPSAGGVGGVWTSTGHDTSDDIGYIVDYYYNDNLIKSALILKDKLLPNAAPNHAFENLGAELAVNGGLHAPAAFNVKIENSVLVVSFGGTGSKEYSVKVYTAINASSGINLYTNGQAYSSEEQIMDVTGFTLLSNGDVAYGSNGQKVAARLAITDENDHSTLQASGWNASGMSYYDAENQKGAYAGYDFGQEILVTKAKFWLTRFSGQNKTLIATIEYLDGNGNWNEIQDLEITNTLDYPSNIFEVAVGRNIYGIRWIHKKDPMKTSYNNITFAGMSVYRGIGQPINVYIPDSSGLNMPPTGFDGFGPVLVRNGAPSEIIPSLPNSDLTKILANAYPGNYTIGSTAWDTLEVGNTDYIAKNLNSIDITNGAYARLDLSEPNHSCVAYFVGVNYDYLTNWPRIISFTYSHSSNNEITLDSSANILYYAHYGNTIAQTAYKGIQRFVCALRIDGTNKLSSCFINGTRLAEPASFNNSGQYCTFGCSLPNQYYSSLSINYIGIVDGIEDDSTIISNLQYLMNLYGIE